MSAIKFAEDLESAVEAARRGDVLAAVRKTLDAVIDVIPHDEAAKQLSEAGIRRAEATADIAEQAKFGAPQMPADTEDP